jgi:hypothetical protein
MALKGVAFRITGHADFQFAAAAEVEGWVQR